jgi:hypothetical protein
MVDYPWGNNQDARGYELKQFKLWEVNGFPTPSGPLTGVIARNTVNGQIAVCDGSAWTLVATDSPTLEGHAAAYFQDLANIPNGNLAAARVSGLQAVINATKLNALTAPDADVDFNSHSPTGLRAASASTDAVRKSDLDAVAVIANAAAAGVSYKNPVRAVSTTNLTLSGTQTVDTVVLVDGDRILVAGQTAGAANGLYVVHSGAWTRTSDADTNGELAPGTQVVVNEGTNGDQPWYLTADAAITIGTTVQVWNKLPFPTGEIGVAGAGMTKSGSTYDVGATVGGLITVGADSIGLTRGTAGTKRAAAYQEFDITGAGSGTVDLAHGFGYQWVSVKVYELVTGTWSEIGGIGVEPYSTSNCRLYFGFTPLDGTIKVCVTG